MIYCVLKDFGGPVATIIAAGVAVTVTGYYARRQWRTAHEKLLLDLFDKRFALDDELISLLWSYAADTLHVGQVQVDFARAASRAQFLFGPEVQTFLKDKREALLQEFAAVIREGRSRPDEEEQLARGRGVDDFVRELDKLVADSMNLHQKALRSLWG
jgi:hypothetical protein